MKTQRKFTAICKGARPNHVGAAIARHAPGLTPEQGGWLPLPAHWRQCGCYLPRAKSASSGGRIHGASDLVVDLESVSVAGQQYGLSTTDFIEKGKDGIGANKRTAEYAGGGAALGAVIGAIAGGGKGAAIGAGSGAGAGALTEIITKGGAVKIPAETLMTFKLEQPVRIVERR